VVDEREAEHRGVAGRQIAHGEAQPAHALLDGAAEDVQKEQVAQQMQPAGVHEERGERREIRPERTAPHAARHDAPVLEVRELRPLERGARAVAGQKPGGRPDEEDHGAQDDEQAGHQGKPGLPCITERGVVHDGSATGQAPRVMRCAAGLRVTAGDAALSSGYRTIGWPHRTGACERSKE
jgi:hypothetical protein